MHTHKDRLQYLVNQYLDDTCTPEELEEFWLLIHNLDDETPIQQALLDLWQRSKTEGGTIPLEWERVLQRVYDNANAYVEEPQVVPLYRRRIIRWVAAAAVVLLLGAGSYWWLNKPSGSTGIVAADVVHEVRAPQTNRATITLSNGKVVYLDSTANGSLVTQGNVQLVKLADGQIIYNGSANEIVYNKLINPRGSKVIDMGLSDGSHVWLNAGSSITYPIAFVGPERKVSITGEAYFEVTHNPAIPFKVMKGETEIEVLGTHFNVNSYEDEPDIRITLLEGVVRVTNKGADGFLKPGEQAQVATDIKVVKGVDVDLIMAWKNGVFSFKATSLEEMMRQIARWYDVTIKFEGRIPERRFRGKIHRNADVSQVLEILKESNVHYRINDREIVIVP